MQECQNEQTTECARVNLETILEVFGELKCALRPTLPDWVDLSDSINQSIKTHIINMNLNIASHMTLKHQWISLPTLHRLVGDSQRGQGTTLID